MKYEDGRGGNMLILEEMYDINKEDLKNIKNLIKRSERFIKSLEEVTPFSWELKWENENLLTLQKIERLLENDKDNKH